MDPGYDVMKIILHLFGLLYKYLTNPNWGAFYKTAYQNSKLSRLLKTRKMRKTDSQEVPMETGLLDVMCPGWDPRTGKE